MVSTALEGQCSAHVGKSGWITPAACYSPLRRLASRGPSKTTDRPLGSLEGWLYANISYSAPHTSCAWVPFRGAYRRPGRGDTAPIPSARRILGLGSWPAPQTRSHMPLARAGAPRTVKSTIIKCAWGVRGRVQSTNMAPGNGAAMPPQASLASSSRTKPRVVVVGLELRSVVSPTHLRWCYVRGALA